MRQNVILFFLSISFLTFGQEKQFVVSWNGTKLLQTSYGEKILPNFDTKHFNFDITRGLLYFAQWDATNGIVNPKSVSIKNATYEVIAVSELKDLKQNIIPKTPNLRFFNTNARGKKSYFIEISPIINDNGVFKKITEFTISFASNKSNQSNLKSLSTITNSVLSSGQWYRFYIEKSGVFKLTKSFLTSLGVSSNVDPRTVKIFGNGGRMLPLANAANYPFDVEENAIKSVGESDGSFDNNDYILFYGEGPNTYSTESDTNINLYTDKTYYYVNVSGGFGKRIAAMPTINAAANIQISTFQDYQFYEVDAFNLAKLGRRWFGDAFNVENQRVYEFNFPNLITTVPVDLKIAVGAVSEVSTSMSITVNNNPSFSLSLSAVDLGSSLLASSNVYDSSINATSDAITIALDYNNSGNPAANAYLDYINIEATRALTYDGEQLKFKNNSVVATPGIAEYTISNANVVSEVWDITDRFNVENTINSNNNSFSFKTTSGEQRTYIAFSEQNVFSPLKDAVSVVENQDLKGTIFNNAQGQFEDIDYIIITPNILKSQAERLAQINRNQYNLNVKVVTLDEIYTEFSTGSQDIAAIRNFIKYVYDNASSEANRLKYVCLFGEGSYDYKNRVLNNTNVVPSWYSLSSFSLINSFVSDDFYGMLDANEGTMSVGDRLDIAVGRILAEDIQRAKAMVDKIEAYYQPEALGSWRNNVVVISDDVDIPIERELQETTEGLGVALEQQKPFFNVTKIHSDAYQQVTSAAGNRYPSVNTTIREALQKGALVVNYFGHGGEDGLAKERIFDKVDAQEINNICKFNLFVTVTCEYTKFDDPSRLTAGEFTFWNEKGGAVALITTTRQIFLYYGVAFNETLDDYLFAFGNNDYPSIGEALRLTKADNAVSGNNQKRLVFLIGDPAMKLTIPKPDIRLTSINNTPITQPTDTLKALSYAKLTGEVTDTSGNLLSNYNGILTATVFDKEIIRQTLGNDNTVDSSGNLITLNYNTLGEVIFKGQATITNGQFEFDFIVPRDIGIPVGNGKVSFYAQQTNSQTDQTGANFDIKIGGINETAPADNTGPIINLFMNDENFVSGGITNESPTLLANLQDENGINTASGIGHDITAVLDGDETNPIVLNDYYIANLDDYTQGKVSYPFKDLEPGLHTLTFKAWDVYNNSSTAEIQFNVFDKDEGLVINNVLNYPNPFVSYTEFWFNHNSEDALDISVQIFTISGKLVRTLNGQTSGGSKTVSSLSKDIVWDGRDDFGDKIGKGVYIYKLKVKSERLNKQVEKIEKLVIL